MARAKAKRSAKSKAAAKAKAKARRPKIGQADRALLLADAERLQDFDHAGRVQAALHHDPGEHFQGRAVQAGLPENFSEQPHAGDRRSGTAPADGRSRSSSPAPSCNISGARPASSIRTTSAQRVEVEQWLFWQMGGVGPMAGQVHHFKNYAVETLTYAINRYINEVNRLYGVMNLRLKDREFIAGKYSIADMALVGWVNGWERQGQDINEFPQPQALARDHEGAPRGQTRHVARPRTAPGHRHEGSEGAGGTVRAARAHGINAARRALSPGWLVSAYPARLALPQLRPAATRFRP